MNKTIGFGIAAGLALAASAATAQSGYYGGGYYGNSGAYGGRIRCESRDNRTTWCGVDTRYGVRLVDQTSRNSCIRGRTWGTDQRGLWVARGCRGIFEVGASTAYNRGYDSRYNGNGYYDNRYNDSRYYDNRGYGSGGGAVRCESRDERTRYCGIDTRYGVSLVDQHSQDPCIRGRTWGVSTNRVWLTRGCRATFAVGSGGYGYQDRYRY
jgi:hypothetical protein